METYGDLKKLIKIIQLKTKGSKIGGVAVDAVLDAIPGANTAKNIFDFVKVAYYTPDDKKPKNWIGKLDIDDEYSKIVDDTIENGFLKVIGREIASKPDNAPLEDDFDMNDLLSQYIATNYKKRTVTGISENISNMKKSQIKKIIKEALLEQDPEEQTPNPEQEKLQGPIMGFIDKMSALDGSIDKALLKQAVMLLASGKGITQIKHKDEIVKTFNALIKSGDPGTISKIFITLKQLKTK